jgi:hypothetical protein
MKSVQKGNVEMCKFLIDNGALSSINTFNKVNICYYMHICMYIYIYIYTYICVLVGVYTLNYMLMLLVSYIY